MVQSNLPADTNRRMLMTREGAAVLAIPLSALALISLPASSLRPPYVRLLIGPFLLAFRQ